MAERTEHLEAVLLSAVRPSQEQEKRFLAFLAEKYGEGTAELTIREQYRNMAEILQHHPDVVEQAKRAIRAVGLTPVSNPVRGGTDGAQLSFRGLPCPNLGTGAYALHGPYEHAIAEQMDVMTEILLHIAQA